MYLLDTNTVSDLMRRPAGVVHGRIVRTDRPVVTSIVVAAEVRFGLERNPSARLALQVATVLGSLPIMPLEIDADHHYARTRADLQRRGAPIGANDLLIAAHALALNATLVTDNVREFSRVDGLTVENWLRD